MPALPSSLIDPLWDQFAALIPHRVDTHPLGCHRPRIADRVVFDKLVQVLVLGCHATSKIADGTCSATTIRNRRDEWIHAGVFDELEPLACSAYDRIVGLDLDDVTVDGCIVKAPCGGEVAGQSPVDRGKLGTKRSVLVDSAGIPLGCVIAPANRHDSPLLRPTLAKLARFDHGTGLHPARPNHRAPGRRVRLCQDPRPARRAGLPRRDQRQRLPPASRRPMGGRTNQLLAQPRIQEARHLYRTARSRHRSLHRLGQRRDHHPTTNPRCLDHPPLGYPTRPTALTYPRDL